MRTIICLLLVSFGLGVDAQSGSTLEVITGLSFFFGSVGLAQPTIKALASLAAKQFPIKPRAIKKAHR